MGEEESVFCGEAAIREGNIVHSLLMWLRSIVVHELRACKQHSSKSLGAEEDD